MHDLVLSKKGPLFLWIVMGILTALFLVYSLVAREFYLGDGVLLFAAAKSPPLVSATTFHVTSGSNENYFYRDNITTAQLLLTSTTASNNVTRRLVAALPAGNNGALVYFLPQKEPSSVPLNLELVNGSMKSVSLADGNRGIQADMTLTANATLGVTIVGAVRALRDYVEGSGTMHEIFNYTLASHSPTEVRLHRQYINSTSVSPETHDVLSSTDNTILKAKPSAQTFKSVDLYLSVPPGSSARFSVDARNESSPVINIVIPTVQRQPVAGMRPPTVDAKYNVRIQVVTNETSLAGLDVGDLFLSPVDAATDSVKTALQNLPADVSEQVSFLTFQNKFTAGGWRFLTYFGRDSLIALRMLMPLLTPSAIEDALGAVIERANSTGALCHEETIDLLLLPALQHYFVELPQGQNRSAQFLSKQATLQNGTYLDIINRIASYNVNRALPFFTANPATSSQLLAFRPGETVGNWRDSNGGTGFGTIPFDVNVALVPANLRAIDSLARSGILSLQDLDVDGGATNIVQMAEKWESEAPGMFEVVVDADTAEQRLKNFVQAVDLDDSLLGNGTATTGNVSFYALSLMPDGTPVEVLNSDLGFNLMYGTNVSAVFLQRVVDALTPYPRGLLTNIGMVVANPAYDSNTADIQLLDRTAYHGTVVWSFQQALMAGGLARQLKFCLTNTTSVDINPLPSPPPAWCGDAELVQSLQDAQTRLWASINGASDNIYSEVWSYAFDQSTKTFSVADIAALSSGVESDAIQLWSYGFLGLIEPE
ncbi:hypothetical protein JR316_0002583 [Psilocybe cubensis]|uniref:Uncharacterized protein n=1 Tax=Psilocybe cubensis TaxID=181762 RepID=A0ACB8HCE1_PSICU|nr:hypothetical protein JR316_0002583 [Psilocybe cubensis]KAH9485673.1 hypothetical protein JR316_0002583 [Psilocybe cubensis]